MLDCKVATIVLVLCGLLATAFSKHSQKQGTSVEENNLVFIRGTNSVVTEQLQTFKTDNLKEHLLLNIWPTTTPSCWNEEVCKALQGCQYLFRCITIFKIEKIEYPFCIKTDFLHVHLAHSAVDVDKRSEPISFENTEVKSLCIEAAIDEGIPSTSLHQLRLNQQLRELKVCYFGEFYEVLEVLGDCSKNIKTILWIGKKGVLLAKCHGSDIIAEVETNSLKVKLIDFLNSAQIQINVTVRLGNNLIDSNIQVPSEYNNPQNSLSPDKKRVQARKVSRSGSVFGMGTERRRKEMTNIDASTPKNIQKSTRALTMRAKQGLNRLSGRKFANSIVSLLHIDSQSMKKTWPNSNKKEIQKEVDGNSGSVREDGFTPELVHYSSSFTEGTPSLFSYLESLDTNRYVVDNFQLLITDDSKEGGNCTLNRTEKEIQEEENQNQTWIDSPRDDDVPVPEPVDITSNNLVTPQPLEQNDIKEVRDTQMPVSTAEESLSAVSRKYPTFHSDPNVDLVLRITIVVVFCGILPLLVAFCVYRCSRSRSSLIEPVSFAVRTRADIRCI